MGFGGAFSASRQIALVGMVLSGWTLPGLAQEIDSRLPIPDRQSQAQPLQLVHELYRQEFDRIITRSQRSELALKLLDQGLATRQDHAGRYVLLDLAVRTAVEARDMAMAFRAIDETARLYRVPAGELKSSAVTRIVDSAKSKTDRRVVVFSVLDAIDEAVLGDDYAMAERLAEIASDNARATRDGTLVRFVKGQVQQANNAAEAYREVQDALATLSREPTDPEANLVVGTHYCLRKRKWKKGIPHLAGGSNSVLKAAALQELKGVNVAVDMVDVADRWLEASEHELDWRQAAILARAEYWYRRSRSGLSGLTQQKVQKQLEEFRRSPNTTRGESEHLYNFAAPKRPIMVDDHQGEAGGANVKTVYRFASPRPVSLRQTAVLYQGYVDGGHSTNGTVTFSLDGNTWLPIGEWTQVELAAAGGPPAWHRADFLDLEKEVLTRQLFVKFKRTSGSKTLVVLRAVWSYENQ